MLTRLKALLSIAVVVATVDACTSNYTIYPNGYNPDDCTDEENDGDGDNECSDGASTDGDSDSDNEDCLDGDGEDCEDKQGPCETALDECLDAAQNAEQNVACDVEHRECTGEPTACEEPFESCIAGDEGGEEGQSDQEICSCMYYLCTGEFTPVDHSDSACASEYDSCLNEESVDMCECGYRECAGK